MTLSVSVLGPPVVLATASRGGRHAQGDGVARVLAVEGGVHNRDSLASCSGPTRDPSALARRCGGRSRRCARRSAAAGSTSPATRSRSRVAELDLEEFHRLAASGELARSRTGGGAPPRPVPRGLRAARQHRLRRLAVVPGRVARARARQRPRPARRRLRCRRATRCARSSMRGAGSRSTRSTRPRTAADRLYGASGERAAALAQYRDCVRTLHRELGVSPTEETTAAYHAVREGGRRGRAGRPERASRRPAHPLVGRDRELSALLDAYAQVGDEGRLVVLDGETGIGKTRLADELVSRRPAAASRDRPLHRGRGRARLRLRDRARAARSARATRGAIARPRRAETRASRARARRRRRRRRSTARRAGAVARRRRARARRGDGGDSPGLLVVDDVHWADASSLEVLAFLVRRLRDRPVLVLGPGARRRRRPGIRRAASSPTRPARAPSLVLDRLDATTSPSSPPRPARRPSSPSGCTRRRRACRLRRRVPRPRAAARLPPGCATCSRRASTRRRRDRRAGDRGGRGARAPVRLRAHPRGERPGRGGDGHGPRGADPPRPPRRERRGELAFPHGRRGGSPTT